MGAVPGGSHRVVHAGRTRTRRRQVAGAGRARVRDGARDGAAGQRGRRDPASRDHRQGRDALKALSPGFDFQAFFDAAQLPLFDELNVGWPDFFRGLGPAWSGSPLETLKRYVRWRLLHTSATWPVISVRAGELRVRQHAPPRGQGDASRWRRCVTATDRALGEALGRLHVERTFGADGKAAVRSIVHRCGMRSRRTSWVSAG